MTYEEIVVNNVYYVYFPFYCGDFPSDCITPWKHNIVKNNTNTYFIKRIQITSIKETQGYGGEKRIIITFIAKNGMDCNIRFEKSLFENYSFFNTKEEAISDRQQKNKNNNAEYYDDLLS